MKREDIAHKLLQDFDAIENITASDNWNIIFQNKLDASRKSKHKLVTKFNIMIMALVFINIGFLWNSLKVENSKAIVDRGSKFEIISKELLITSNN